MKSVDKDGQQKVLSAVRDVYSDARDAFKTIREALRKKE